MPDAARYVDPEGAFELRIPPGWTAEPDTEDGGVELFDPAETGVLHVIGFAQPEAPDDEVADPAEELYAFLDEQGIELEDDDVEDLAIQGGEMALCEYIVEEDGENGEPAEAAFWLMGVATAPGQLIFASYTCPAGSEEVERETVREVLRSIRVPPPA